MFVERFALNSKISLLCLFPRTNSPHALNRFFVDIISAYENSLQPPPRELPAVILKEKTAYNSWSLIRKDLPVIERLGIGDKLESLFISLLEITFFSSYQSIDKKITSLELAIARLDAIKFFLQIAWERKLIATDSYSEISVQLEEVGKMLGGWKKGLLNKTPTR